MADAKWKAFERSVAALIGGRRHWSNSGEKIDVTSDRFVAQCKLVSRMSLEELTALVESVDRDPAAHGCLTCRAAVGACLCAETSRSPEPGRLKLGVVCIKVRRGKGKPSPTLVVMTSETFTRLVGYTQGQP